MTRPELLTTAIHQHPARAAQPVPSAPAGRGDLLRFQLKRLVGEILADPDLDPNMYVSLLGHLAKYPGHPEQALLAHLGEVQGQDDLPPYKAGKKPTIQPPHP
jgi:hypothetical protein